MIQKSGKNRSKKGVTTTNSEVVLPKQREKRHLTAQYKHSVLAEIDQLAYGEIRAYLRKEGLYLVGFWKPCHSFTFLSLLL